MFFDVPVDHHSLAPIAQVPFGHEVLVPRPKLGRVRGAGSGALTPDVGQAHLEGGIGDVNDGGAQLVLVQVAAARVEQLLIALAVIAHTHALEPGVGAQTVEAEQEAFLESLPVECLARGGALEVLGKANAQVCLFENIEEIGHAPAPIDFRLEPA